MKPHIKTENCKKPYDDKKSCWVPNPKGEFGGYLEGITENVLMCADWEAVGESSKPERYVVILNLYFQARKLMSWSTVR